ncbi:hypothetical protein Poli38472_007868 [Pythium oligandrum]|uniref:Uncharacterized protein n=1 Tax=Pythium oligandrum TaxID=41045 RepID=A0A8K1CQY0_PYTOL|nr:hypothetical protein Poli38472_007868 [Pythium oligandrum]|eukprot:TMW68196.1 hypothetical protein Poli38472_007868 [Pythium oligandrum]
MDRCFQRHTAQVAPNGPTLSADTTRSGIDTNVLRPSYSTDKFLVMRAYCRAVTPWRMVWVCSTLALPALLAATVPVFIPLRHPREGITLGCYVHSFCIIFATTLGGLLNMTAATDFTRADFTLLEMAAVSLIAVLVNALETFIICEVWTFPVPFAFVIFSPFFNINLSVGLLVVVRRRLWTNPIFKRSVQLYNTCMNIQMIQIIIYPAISVLYDTANNTQRILLTIFFPVVKYGLKRLLNRAGRQLGDYQTEVAVSGVEICASLYQSMIMQTVPSTAAMGIIMGLDVVQGMMAIKFFADRQVKTSIPRKNLFDEAERLLTETVVVPGKAADTDQRGSKHGQEHKSIIKNALQLANTAESILLIEYYEVVIPVVNGVFLLIAAQFPSAQFNSRIRPFYHDPVLLSSSLLSLLLYSVLQGLSCVAMHLVMKYRYGISAVAHLSFVLERYHQSILGMMVAWLPIILHFTLMHYGSDFTFRFHFQDDYCSTFALPAFVAATIPVFIPLKHPREGANLGYYFHCSTVTFLTIFGTLLHSTAATEIPSTDFSIFQMVVVSLVAVLLNVVETVVVCKYWRFPVPFGIVVFSPAVNIHILIGLLVVLRQRLWKRPVYKRANKVYSPSLNIQVIQIIIYPAISVLYDKANNTQRILLTIFFPIVKYGLKWLLRRAGKQLGDYQTEMAVSGVEICAALYQSMITQTVPSTIAMAIIMGLDVVQGIIAIKYLADRHVDPLIPRLKLFEETERLLILSSTESSSRMKGEQQATVQRALALANTAESILLIDYYEVIIPIVNGLFLLVAAQLPSAQFNSRIRPFYQDPNQLRSALLSMVLYSLLQGLSCVVMHLVMKYRYGISAIAHLSFVLERYYQHILGKMIAWLPIILHFTVMHYGKSRSRQVLENQRIRLCVAETLSGSCLKRGVPSISRNLKTAPAAFTSADFSLLEMIAVSIIADVMYMIETLVLIKYWCFPIPFSIIVFSPLFNVNILVGLVIILGRRLWTRPFFKRSVKLYGMCMNIQMVQIVVYPAISVLYDMASNTQRILLTMFFHVIKYGLKRLLKRVGRQLGAYQTEVAVCGVEICGSLYQSMIMQTVPSAAATGVIMGLDVVQRLIAIKLFADRHSDPLVPRPKLFDKAERLLTLHPATLHSEPSQPTIQRALALALTAESILLVEYFEVIIPFFNGVFLLIAAQLPSAQYNSRIAPFYHDRDRLGTSIRHLGHCALVVRLGAVPPVDLGMMISWLPIILHFTLVHYGSDITFRFDLNDNTCVTPRRAGLVLFVFPIPSLVCALLPAFAPLQAPSLGPGYGFYLHAAIVVFFASIGTILHWSQASGIERSVFSYKEMLCISFCCCFVQTPEIFLVHTLVRFPVPFLWILTCPLWAVNLGLAIVVVLGGKLRRHAVFRESIGLYGPCMLIQCAQIAVYPAVPMVYSQVETTYQILIAFFFPVVKFLWRQILRRYSRGQGSSSTETTVCGVEICASMYQSMIMQTAPSITVMVIAIVIDTVQSIFSVRMHIDALAVSWLPHKRHLVEAARALSVRSILPAEVTLVQSLEARSKVVRVSVDSEGKRLRASFVAIQSLQIADAAEYLFLIEYFEVVIPAIHSVFLLVASQLPSAQFNTGLHEFHQNSRNLMPNVVSIWIYTLLQAASFAVMHWILKRRYGVPSFTYLAFVLERHGPSIMGKMVMWLPIIMHFTLQQYGTDFSFSFDQDTSKWL